MSHFNRPFPNNLSPISQSESWCPSIWSWDFIHMQIKLIFLSIMVLHQVSLCRRGLRQLGNGLPFGTGFFWPPCCTYDVIWSEGFIWLSRSCPVICESSDKLTSSSAILAYCKLYDTLQKIILIYSKWPIQISWVCSHFFRFLLPREYWIITDK